MNSILKDLVILAGMIVVILMSLLVAACLSGCTQVIIEPDRFKVNTFLMTSGLETLYYDPNGFFEVGKYKGVPSNIELVYDPLTGEIKVVTKANK